ncbi:MAG: DUF4331 family protein [Gemmatimonadaceae bacterium]
MKQWMQRRGRLTPVLAVATIVAGLTTAGLLRASDHQDTPTVELNSRYDVNDVYAFPASTPGRIALVLSTSSPITPAQTPSFTFGNRSKELYQLKIDNNGDAMEDLVFQFTFSGPAGGQQVAMFGPVKPNEVGTANTLLQGEPTLAGPVNTVLGSSNGIQLFAGPRDDPFFIDLEYFFRIIPDRKPVTGPLSELPDTATASSFRPAGQAQDYVRGYNDMAIVVELPVSMLVADPNNPAKFGVWATTSRPRRGPGT